MGGPSSAPVAPLISPYNGSTGGRSLEAGVGTGDVTLATLHIPAHELPAAGGLFFIYNFFINSTSPMGSFATAGTDVFVTAAMTEPSSLILLGTALPDFVFAIRRKFAK